MYLRALGPGSCPASGHLTGGHSVLGVSDKLDKPRGLAGHGPTRQDTTLHLFQPAWLIRRLIQRLDQFP